MELTSTIGTIYTRPRQGTRPNRSTQEQIKACPRKFSGTDFLKQQFYPIVSTGHPELKHWRKLEKEFFSSLKHLCRFYDLDFKVDPALAYPVNISIAFQQLSAQLIRKRTDLKLAIIQDDTHLATLATAKTFDTNTTLYYIPCEPVYRFMQNGRRKLTDLCLSIFTYLYQIIEVPYHRDYTYMCSMYDLIEQWMDEDEEDDREAGLAELREIEKLGDFMQAKMSDKSHLQKFEQRVTFFKPRTKAERDFLATAIKAFELYRDYPNRSIFDSIYSELFEQDEDSDGTVHVEQYISFLWSFKGDIYDNLEDTINCDLQERVTMEEPTALQVFDSRQTTEVHDLDFEVRLFDLLDQLVGDLRELSYSKTLKKQLA